MASSDTANTDTKNIIKTVYQCTDCLTIYDKECGDRENEIAPGTSFEDLPGSYRCPLCDAGKETFQCIEEDSLKLQCT